MSSSSSSSSAGRLHGDDNTLRLHICGKEDAGANDDGDRATFFGNPCLDFFLFKDHDVATPARHQRLRDLLAEAWDQDALTALKIACYRHNVKRGDGEGFFAAATWILQNHPRVFADNVPAFAELGYVHDLVALLQRLHDHDEPDAPATTSPSSASPVRKRARHDHDADPAAGASASASAAAPPSDVLLADPASPSAVLLADPPVAAHPTAVPLADPAVAAPPSAVPLADPPGPGPVAALELEAGDPKPEAAAAAAPTDNPLYRTLYDAIVDFFVRRLSSDLEHLNNGETSMISLAADWCPSIGSPSDQSTMLRTDIARGMGTKYAHLKDDEDRDKNVLHHAVLQPLVSALHKHKQQASGSETAKPKVQNNLPHFIAEAFAEEVWGEISEQERNETTEQWRSMIDDLRGKGSLTNCIAVCDVSRDGLKKGESFKLLMVCVSLGLLISELSDQPWNNWLHAFSEGDGSHSLADKTSYTEKMQAIRVMECNEKFNPRKVLEWVLDRASSNNLDSRDMVKKIFVFTGKDFDEAIVPPSNFMRPEDRIGSPSDFDPEDVRRWNDDYRIVCDKFKQNGYDDCVPGIVLWNLMGDRSAALTSTPMHGVMTLSGYSDNLMSMFLEKGGVVHAEDEMDAAISGEEYQKLEVKY